ncbi:MAG: alpha/beta fold hydrolase [Acidimicrobiales bacterium]
MGEARAVAVRGGQRMAVRCWGRGFPVVLVHGIPGSARTWGGVARRLAERHRVAVPDLLGFGSSTRPTAARQLHAEGQADALGDALDALGIDRMVLVGHDFGGPVAVTCASRRPERVAGLVLLATNAFGDSPVPFPLSLVTAPVVGPAASRLLFSGLPWR